MITSFGLHPFSKWEISGQGTEGRSGKVLVQSPNKDHREPSRECSHSKLPLLDVTTTKSPSSTSTSMLHLLKKQLESVRRVLLVRAVA